MACVNCGACSYDENSLATFTYVVQANGPRQCADNQTKVLTGLVRTGNGTWSTSVNDVDYTVARNCTANTWNYSIVDNNPPGGGGGGSGCTDPATSVVANVIMNTCLRYEWEQTTTYADGSTVKIIVKVKITNNGTC